MWKGRAGFTVLLVAALIVGRSTCAYAEKGFYLEYQARIEGALQAVAPRITKTWLTADKARFESDETIIIERIDLQQSYRLDPVSKNYIAIPFITENPQGFRIYTEPLKGVKEVDGRKAAGMRITIEASGLRPLVQQVYYSKDFDIDADEFYQYAFQFPTLKHSLAPFRDLKAFVVLSTQDAPEEAPQDQAGNRLVTRLKTLEQREIDDSLFSVPPYYTLEQNQRQ